jgi:cobalt/nickel transport system permease protein
MEPNFLDRYSRQSSPVHRWLAGLKLVAALVVVAALLFLPAGEWLGLAVVALLLLTVAGISRIPWAFLMKRVLFLEFFILGVAVMTLVEPGGWRLFLFLITKCTLCLLTMVLLSNTTPFAELLRVLKGARLPAVLVTTLSLMYRYMFVAADEAQRMKRARMSRTFLPARTRVWWMRATVVGQLFIRSSERAERIYGAMRARGWR